MAKKPGSGTSKIILSGTSGRDVIDGRTYSASDQDKGFIINGGAGDDVLIGGLGMDVLNGGDGNDILHASLSDLIGVAGGAIVYDGGRGSDELDLSAIESTEGKGIWIRFDGDRGYTDFVRTNVDKSDISVTPSGEPLNEYGQATGTWTYETSYDGNYRGIENFTLGAGNDLIYMLTGGGNNVINARSGNDWVEAGDGNDTVDGGDGNDILSGGWGDDILTGSAGNDAFLFRGRLAGQYSHDIITDFDPKEGSDDASYDQIWLLNGWSIVWDSASPNVLRGFLMDGSTTWGELTLQGLTYEQRDLVPVHNLSSDPLLL